MVSETETNILPRILFISHDAGRLGAQISLSLLLKEFSLNTSWQYRIIIRENPGPLMRVFAEFGPTDLFFRFSRGKVDSFLTNKARRSLNLLNYIYSAYSQICKFKRSFQQKRWEASLREDIAAWKPDLIYSNTAMNGDVIRSLAIDAPIVVHVRELDWFLSALDSKRLDAFKTNPALYFTASKAVKDNLENKYEILPSKIEVAHAAVSPEIILQKSKEISVDSLRRRLGISDEAIVIGAVGRVDRRKGSDLFSEIGIKVLNSMTPGKEVVFMWVGNGPDREEVANNFKRANLGEFLFLVGDQENPYPYINCLDILLMCSRDDPFPRVNLEAGVLEKPIVAFGCSGGSKEFIEEDCGFVISKIDIELAATKLMELIDKPDLRQFFGSKARQKVYARFDIKIIARKIITRLNKNFSLEPIMQNN